MPSQSATFRDQNLLTMYRHMGETRVWFAFLELWIIGSRSFFKGTGFVSARTRHFTFVITFLSHLIPNTLVTRHPSLIRSDWRLKKCLVFQWAASGRSIWRWYARSFLKGYSSEIGGKQSSNAFRSFGALRKFANFIVPFYPLLLYSCAFTHQPNHRFLVQYIVVLRLCGEKQKHLT